MTERKRSYFSMGWDYADNNPEADPQQAAERLFKRGKIPEWAKDSWLDGFMAYLIKQTHERNKQLANPRSKK